MRMNSRRVDDEDRMGDGFGEHVMAKLLGKEDKISTTRHNIKYVRLSSLTLCRLLSGWKV
jgi:hypothetical protein